MLHDCGYTTPSLYHLVVSQLECLHTLLFHPAGTRVSLNHTPTDLVDGDALQPFPAQKAQSRSSAELQPTGAASHTHLSVSQRCAIMHLCFERAERAPAHFVAV